LVEAIRAKPPREFELGERGWGAWFTSAVGDRGEKKSWSVWFLGELMQVIFCPRVGWEIAILEPT
jgi:hypothetical protein